MLICLLTALIARSSHRSLQREDAFFPPFFSRGKEESREEKKKKKGTEGEGHLHIIYKLSLTHIAWQTHKKIATLHVLQGGGSPRKKKKKKTRHKFFIPVMSGTARKSLARVQTEARWRMIPLTSHKPDKPPAKIAF